MKIKFFLSTLIIAGITYNMYAQDTTKAKPEFKPSGKVWGLAFGDYAYKTHADSMGRGNSQYSGAAFPKYYNAFEFRRIYLGYDYNISEKFSAELLLAYQGQTLSDGATRTVYIKSANLRWKNIWKNTDLIIGQSQTPTWPLLTEKLWNYRSVEKTVLDMRKLGSDNDMGISLQSKIISNDKTEVGYNFMIGNGTAQKLEMDKFKKYYGDVYVKLMNKKIVVDLYSDYERSQINPYPKSKATYKIAVAYMTDRITIGMEGFQQYQESATSHSISPSSTSIDKAIAMGISGYVRGQILKDRLNFFLRYDVFDPDITFDSDNTYIGYTAYNTEKFITYGLDFTPMKNIHFIPNIWYNSYTNRKNNVNGLAKTDNDMVARMTVHYIFK